MTGLEKENEELRGQLLRLRIGIAHAKELHKEFMDCLVELLEADASDEMKVTGMMIALHKHIEASMYEEEG